MIYYFVVLVLLKVKYMKFSKKEIFTIPNILTYIRILCVPFFIWFMLDTNIPNNVYIAFGLFMFASITDMVDGFIARHYHLISDIGKIADPIADKLLQVSTLLCLTIIAKISWVFPMVFFIMCIHNHIFLSICFCWHCFKSFSRKFFFSKSKKLHCINCCRYYCKSCTNHKYYIDGNIICVIHFAFKKCKHNSQRILDTNKKCDCDTGEDNNNVLLEEKQESDT